MPVASPSLADAVNDVTPLTQSAQGRRVILGHDWLTGMRGGERVFEYFCRAFPEADIGTLIYNPSVISDVITSHTVHPSFMNRIPGISKHYRNFLPLMPAAARSLKLPPADLLLTTSHCVAKSFKKPTGAKHLCVSFTPMRYAWTFFDEYFGSSRIKATIAKPMLARLRDWDKRTADEVDLYVAISKHIADRIHRFYGRESVIVYPPVDTARCTPSPDASCTADYDLIVSALVPYKRVDLAVELYSKKGWPLKVVGVGGQLEMLKQMAGPSVQIMGARSDNEILNLYRNCRMLIFPGEEDYGIVPLEAQACGRPVVAFEKGGALETVADGKTGVFFKEQSLQSLEDGVLRCAKMPIDATLIRSHACNFGPEQFIQGMAHAVTKVFS